MIAMKQKYNYQRKIRTSRETIRQTCCENHKAKWSQVRITYKMEPDCTGLISIPEL